MQTIDFWTLLPLVQQYITENYSAVLTDKEKLPQIKSYIEKYLRDMEYIACCVNSIDVCVQLSWLMLTGESPVVVKVGQPLSK